jgi:hypothetical protein
MVDTDDDPEVEGEIRGAEWGFGEGEGDGYRFAGAVLCMGVCVWLTSLIVLSVCLYA